MTNKRILIIGAIALAFVILFIYVKEVKAPTHPLPGGGGQVACPADAKLCPDGSAVGRVAPSCDFAPCPTVPATDQNAPITITAQIDQAVAAHDIKITPLTIMQDSRCPVDVVCIQAGTVQVLTRVASSTDATSKIEKILALGDAMQFGNYTITFTSAAPAKRSTETLESSDYQLTFEIKGNQ